MDMDAARAFILANTAPTALPGLSELRFQLADECYEIWRMTEVELRARDLPLPFWAFAWVGGRGLARAVLDNPAWVRGRRVLDFACGAGLVGLAAARAGAASVLCADIDPFCAAAVPLNAALNDLAVDFTVEDLVDTDPPVDLILAGDIFYDLEMSRRLKAWFGALTSRGVEVIIGDPRRRGLDLALIEPLCEVTVPDTALLEDAPQKQVLIGRFRPLAAR
jgi:predicted nicotinamide N-methyase